MGCIFYELQYHQSFIPHFDVHDEKKDMLFAFLEGAMGPFKPYHAMEIHSYRKDIFDGNTTCPRVVLKDEDQRETLIRMTEATESNLVRDATTCTIRISIDMTDFHCTVLSLDK